MRPHTSHARPALHTATQQHSNTKRKRTAQREGMQCEEDWTMRSAGPNPKTGNTVKKTGATRDKGTTRQHDTPAIQRDHHANGKGDANTQTGMSVTLPPFIHHATHHHDKGGGRQRIPHHTNTTHRHTPTHHTPGKEQRTTRPQYSPRTEKAEHKPGHTHWTVQSSSSTHHRHSTHHTNEKDGHHPYCLTLTHLVHTTNEQS